MSPKTEETSVEAPSAAAASAETKQTEKIQESDGATESTDAVPEEPAETVEQKTERAKKLFEDGRRAFLSNSFSDSSKNLADACELYVELYTEFGKECADLYLFYGKTLLELSRMEGGVFSNALAGVEDESAEEMEAEEEVEKGAGDADAPKEAKEEVEKGAADAGAPKEASGEAAGDADAPKEASGEAAGDADAPKEASGEAAVSDEKTVDEQFEDAEKLTAEEREEIHEQVEEALEENAEALDAGKVPTSEETGEAKTDDAADAEGEQVPEEPTSTENDEGAGDAETEEEADTDAQAEVGEGAEDNTQDVSNLQLAYENLDMCRIICEKQEGEEWQKKLAECRLTLGEVAIDDERYSDAEDELQECLSIQKKIYAANDRRLAETLFQMGRARNLSNKFTEAADSYKAALDIIKDRLEQSRANVEKTEGEEKAVLEKEVEELASLIPEIESKISDCEGSAKAAEEMKENENGEAKNGDASALKVNASAADKPVENITHLVRKPLKRGAEEELQDDAKKVREEGVNGKAATNGNAAGDGAVAGEA